jgi:hypothetical protein
MGQRAVRVLTSVPSNYLQTTERGSEPADLEDAARIRLQMTSLLQSGAKQELGFYILKVCAAAYFLWWIFSGMRKRE